MTVVLVTGPIGGGKSAVCKYLTGKGFPVYDCDSRCKMLYDEVPGLKLRIEEELGIAFSELGMIFSSDELRLKLEALVYPLLVQDMKAWLSSVEGPLAFVESAIAMDKHEFDGLYDRVLIVTASKAIRYARNPKARLRDRLQNFDLTKADAVIRNNSTLDDLYLKVDNYLKEYKQ
ncbi:MAG: dephospho-CoA kinase [Bacteroidales bacterium]|nr:dephospho-CoA kinase [Bacteroidales bacterium]